MMARAGETITAHRQMPHIDLLDALPTIEIAQASDLKISHSNVRVWVSRCGLPDGEPYEHTVYIETIFLGRWVLRGHYDGQNPPEQIMGISCEWVITTGAARTNIDLVWSLS